MPSHAVKELHQATALPDGQVLMVATLVCGCRIEKRVAADRVIDTVDGLKLAVGKYPCPVDHPVRRP